MTGFICCKRCDSKKLSSKDSKEEGKIVIYCEDCGAKCTLSKEIWLLLLST